MEPEEAEAANAEGTGGSGAAVDAITGGTPRAADPEQAGGTPPAEGDQPAVPAGLDDEMPMLRFTAGEIQAAASPVASRSSGNGSPLQAEGFWSQCLCFECSCVLRTSPHCFLKPGRGPGH